MAELRETLKSCCLAQSSTSNFQRTAQTASGFYARTSRCAEETDAMAYEEARSSPGRTRSPMPTAQQGLTWLRKAPLGNFQLAPIKKKADDGNKLNVTIIKHLVNFKHTAEASIAAINVPAFIITTQELVSKLAASSYSSHIQRALLQPCSLTTAFQAAPLL